MRIEISLVFAAIIVVGDVFSIPARINNLLNECNFAHLNFTGTTLPPCQEFTSTDHATVPTLKNCQKYCQCYNGNWNIQQCSFNRNYDPSSSECVTDSSFCSNNTTTRPEGSSSTTTKPEGPSNKTTRPKGTITTTPKQECQKDEKESETNCLDYKECDNGQWKKTSCFYLRYFNKTSNECESNHRDWCLWDCEYWCKDSRDTNPW